MPQIQWWQLTNTELKVSPEARRAKQAAYKETFYGSESGKDVLFDLTWEIENAQVSDSVKLGLMEFLKTIKRNCGITNERALIDAEADLCEFVEIKETEDE